MRTKSWTPVEDKGGIIVSAPPRYTKEDMQRAVEYLIAHRRNFSETIRQLGYPASRGALRKWYVHFFAMFLLYKSFHKQHYNG